MVLFSMAHVRRHIIFFSLLKIVEELIDSGGNLF